MGGHRPYRAEDARRLGFIRRTRELGFTLDDGRGFLALVDGAPASRGEVKAQTLDHLARVERPIADRRAIAGVLREMADRCDGGDRPDCPIIAVLFP